MTTANFPIPQRTRRTTKRKVRPLSLRVRGASPFDVYCSPSGNDSNSGLNPSDPFLTIDMGIATICSLSSGLQSTVHLAPGTYSSCQLLNYADEGTVAQQTNAKIVGDINNPTLYNIVGNINDSAILAVGVRSLWTIEGVTISSPYSMSYGVELDFDSKAYFKGVHFGQCNLGAVVSIFGSKAEFLNAPGYPIFSLDANVNIVLWAYEMGMIIVQNGPIQFNNGMSWVDFAAGQNNSLIYMGNNRWNGAYNGQVAIMLNNCSGLQGSSNVPSGLTNSISPNSWVE